MQQYYIYGLDYHIAKQKQHDKDYAEDAPHYRNYFLTSKIILSLPFGYQ